MKEIKIKTIIIGDSYCGKTTILNKYVNKNFNDTFMATIGVDYYKSMIIKNDDTYKFSIWDTSGQEKFNSIISSYYRDIGVAIIVFDLTNYNSFVNIKKWLDILSSYETEGEKEKIIKVVVGNKCDLVKERRVSQNDAEKICRKHGLDYLETSAKININIDNIFQKIVSVVESKIEKNCVNRNIRILTKFDIEEHINLKKKHKRNCCVIM